MRVEPGALAAWSDLPGVGWIFDTSNYPPRWYCGTWSPAIGWLHIISDIVIWLAYLAIPISLAYFTRKRGELPFRGLFWLFCAFIVCCGATHLMEAVIFWWPAYGLAGVLKFVTAVVSMVTVLALAPVIPQALAFRSPKQLEEEVEKRTRELDFARRQANLVIETSPAGMVMIDKDGIVLLFNAAAESMFGYDRSEVLGHPIERLLPERYREQHPERRQEFFAQPQTRRMGSGRELSGLRKDGSEFPIEIGLNPVRTEKGLCVLSAIVDITDRKQAEIRVRDANERLTRSNAELEQFAYIASHDLQEPLRKITSYCELLKEEQGDQLNEEGLDYLNVAIRGAGRLSSLVSDLLAFSRLTTRGKPIAHTDANECLEAAIENLEMAIEESGAKVHAEPLPVVMADDGQLILLFQNLLSNAIKYRSEASPEIHVGARDAGGEFEFFVRDNGIGIDPQFNERIFQIFQRLHNKRAYSGTGIGLAFCKRIVGRFGGKIWVDSAPGQGSTFYFTISKVGDKGVTNVYSRHPEPVGASD